jgi:MFS transporter, DHA1 family, inner membrane transport protein
MTTAKTDSTTPLKTHSPFIDILVLTTARLGVNAARRFAYPFQPAISRELGVSIETVQNVTALQAGIGVSSPFFGVLSERFGRKRVMLGVMLLMSGAAGLGVLAPTFGIYFLVMLLFGFGKMVFDPAMQAYIGDRVPYERRGMALGIAELSWAGSLILFAPIAGWLFEVSTLRAVFAVLGALLLTFALVIWRFIPADHRSTRPVSDDLDAESRAYEHTAVSFARLILRTPAALALMGYALCISIANEVLFINYGTFMERSFQLQPAELGILTTVIAAAEICGELLVIGISDRFGKRRLAIIGSGIVYLLLPQLGTSLWLAIAGIFVMFFAVETGIVASFPLMTEVVPQARSMMIATAAGAFSSGRLIGSLLGSRLYSETQDFTVIGIVALIIGLIAPLLLFVFVRHLD